MHILARTFNRYKNNCSNYDTKNRKYKKKCKCADAWILLKVIVNDLVTRHYKGTSVSELLGTVKKDVNLSFSIYGKRCQ